MGRPAKKKDSDKPTKARASRKGPPKSFSTRAATGRSLHAIGIDNRTVWARRQKEIHDQIVADLGGRDLQSELSMQTVRRVTGLIVLAEKAEIALALGEDIEVEKHISVINAFNRTANALGLARKPRDTTPTLEAYIAAKRQEKAKKPPRKGEDEDGGDDDAEA